MKLAIKTSILLLFLGAGVARAESPLCRMIEVEVVGVDASGISHPVFNFGQALPSGTKWSTSQEREHGTMDVSVSWENELDATAPTILLAIRPKRQGSVVGTVKLEQMLWASLYGPDPVLTQDEKPVVLPTVGSLVAVAAVSTVECGEPAG